MRRLAILSQWDFVAHIGTLARDCGHLVVTVETIPVGVPLWVVKRAIVLSSTIYDEDKKRETNGRSAIASFIAGIKSVCMSNFAT